MTDPSQQLDITTRAVNSAIDHAPLLLFLAVAGWKGLPFVLTKFFTNGGGLLIRGLVKAENEAQTALHTISTAKLVADEIAKHQKEEQANLQAALDGLRMEITGEYPLMPRATKRPHLTARPRRSR